MTDEMNIYQYKNLIIEVLDEPNYQFNSTDNKFKYSKHLFGEGGQEYPTSKHGIRIYQNEQIIDNCIVIASGGATGIHQNSSLINNNRLLICCCDTIFCLTLPDLDLEWRTQADPATCFQVFRQQEYYIIHGELQIAKLDKHGNKKWTFGGADIFVSVNGEDEFRIENDGILLTDFAKTRYKIDFDGKLIWHNRKQ